MDISQLESSTLIICKKGDLQEFASDLANKILSGQPVPVMVMPETEKPLSQGEAITFLGKSRQTLNAWRRRGVITGHKLGGRIYFYKSELIAAMK